MIQLYMLLCIFGYITNQVWSFIICHYFYHLYLSMLKIVLKHFKDIKWRQKISCVIKNWRENVHHGFSQLIQYFSIRLYTLVSFYGNIFSPSCLFWKVLWIWGYIWNFLKIKSRYKISKGQWAQTAQAYNKSKYHFSF